MLRRLSHALPQAFVGAFLIVSALRIRQSAPLVAVAACWLAVAGACLVIVAALNVYIASED